MIILIISILFLVTPVMIWRMYAHTALAGQWILLIGLEPIFAHNKYQCNKKIYLIVGLIGILSASIHIYFVLMSGIILLGVCLTDILVYRRVGRSGLMLMEYLIVAATVIWLLGGFNSGMQAQNGGLGIYSSNINTFFNPQGWSRIYRELPLYGDGQYEGFGYLGGGCIILFLLAIICLADKTMQVYLLKHLKEEWAIILIVGISMMVALSPTVTMGERVILQVQLPQWLEATWGIFRASGRIIWSVVYVIMLGSCVVILKAVNKRSLTIATLSIVLLIQVYDISGVLKVKYANFGSTCKFVSKLTEKDFWNYIAQRDDIQHIVYFSMTEESMMYSITDWAMQNKKTVNNFYFARSIDDKVSESRREALEKLSEDTLFIFNNEESLFTLQYALHYYQIDGLIIGYSDEIPGYKEMPQNDVMVKWNFGGNWCISENGGIDTEAGRVIYPEGLSYGPYWSIPKGYYVITIIGESMPEALDIDIYSQYGMLHHDFKTISCDMSEIKLKISLDEDINNLEVCIKNNSENIVLIKSMEIRYGE